MADEHGAEDDEQGGRWPTTVPEGISASIRGLPTEEDAQRLGQRMFGAIRLIGEVINLERLDGVTVGVDYSEALASLDRGKEGLRALQATDEEVIGVAMTPVVLRDGVAKSHLVFSAAFLWPLAEDEPDKDQLRQAVYMVAHECAHVEVNHDFDRAFPGQLLQSQYDWEQNLIQGSAFAIWDEYAASRLSAPFGPEQLTPYLEGLQDVLAAAGPKSLDAIDSFRGHRNVDRLIEEAGPALILPLKMFGYVFGHLDGIEVGWADQTTAREKAEACGYDELAEDVAAACRDLWERRGEWSSQTEFDSLGKSVRAALAAGGVFYRKLSAGGFWVWADETARLID
jgi:hypothetical protein